MTFIFPRAHLSGLTLSTPGSSTSFGIAAGQCADATNSVISNLPSALTKTMALWSAGNGGALDTGSIAPSAWYHVHEITDALGQAADIVASLSPSAPALPTGFALSRRIGSMLTSASSQWFKFEQLGDDFIWDNVFVDRTSAVVGNVSAQTLALTVPSGIKTYANISALTTAGTDTEARALITSLDKPDEAASGSLCNVGASSPNGTTSVSNLSVRTNTSNQIRYRMASNLSSLQVITFGWTDRRGKDA